MLLAGPISHTSSQYMDFVEIFNISLDQSTWGGWGYSDMWGYSDRFYLVACE